MLSPSQLSQFIQNGFLVLKKAASEDMVSALREETRQQVKHRIEPIELETTVQYPGAPKSIKHEGGDTIRRLRDAYHRNDIYADWANNQFIIENIQQILQCKELYLNPNHHNSIMTKNPKFSSQTNWHRDTRYWHFNNKYLINSWLALGPENNENGGLLVLPGSHRWDENSFVLDQDQFLINDHPANKSRLSLALTVELDAGDCLLFSAHCFHAAAQNNTNEVKHSLVFTYHGEKTEANANSNSSLQPPIKIDTQEV